MMTMEQFFLVVGVILIALMLLAMLRALIGPSSIDRIISVNVIGTKATVLLVIIGFIFQKVDMFVDLALTYALLNFIASIAAARMVRRRVIQDTWDKFLGSTVEDKS